MAWTFQQHAAQNLSEFGFTIVADDVPTYEKCVEALDKLTTWSNSLTDQTWAVIRGCDISDGLWYEGFFETWPKLYDLFKNSATGGFVPTKTNISTCVEHAQQQVQDAQDVPIG